MNKKDIIPTLNIRNLLLVATITMLALPFRVDAGHPCCHILICCRGNNKGVTFEVNGEFIPAHDYNDTTQVRDILQKIKDAGIKTVIVDMTNPSQWTRLRKQYEPMVDNVAQVCREKNMQYFLHIGGGFNPSIIRNNNIKQNHVEFWNDISKYIWEKWAQTPEYRKYGYGDERPILLIFRPGAEFQRKFSQEV